MNWCAIKMMLKQTSCFIGKVVMWIGGLWVGVWLPFSWAAHEFCYGMIYGHYGNYLGVNWFDALMYFIIIPVFVLFVLFIVGAGIWEWYDDCRIVCEGGKSWTQSRRFTKDCLKGKK
jgi:hypothetical protein